MDNIPVLVDKTDNLIEVIKTKKPLVALVANTSWSIYNFRLNLIRFLQANGYRILVIAPKDNFSSNLIAEGVSYQHLNLDNYGTNPLSELNIIRQLRKIYRKNDIDFIIHYTIKPNIYGSIAAKLAGIPSIAITTGLGHLLSFSNEFTKVISIFLYKLASSLSKEVWFLNQTDLDDFLRLKIVKATKTFLLPGEGVDTSFFKPQSQKSNGNSMRFLFAGRIIWDKGFREYIEAAKVIKEKFPHCEFDVVGFLDPTNPNAVPYDYILEQQESDLIKFHGETNDIRSFLNRTHCVVFPSMYREGLSRILMEAAAMETPIITTDNVGCKELIDEGVTGFIVPKSDHTQLVEKMTHFINMSFKERLVMGANARLKIIREHDHNNINAIYLKRIKEFV